MECQMNWITLSAEDECIPYELTFLDNITKYQGQDLPSPDWLLENIEIKMKQLDKFVAKSEQPLDELMREKNKELHKAVVKSFGYFLPGYDSFQAENFEQLQEIIYPRQCRVKAPPPQIRNPLELFRKISEKLRSRFQSQSTKRQISAVASEGDVVVKSFDNVPPPEVSVNEHHEGVQFREAPLSTCDVIGKIEKLKKAKSVPRLKSKRPTSKLVKKKCVQVKPIDLKVEESIKSDSREELTLSTILKTSMTSSARKRKYSSLPFGPFVSPIMRRRATETQSESSPAAQVIVNLPVPEEILSPPTEKGVFCLPTSREIVCLPSTKEIMRDSVTSELIHPPVLKPFCLPASQNMRPPAAQLINVMRPPTARQINTIRPAAAQLINTIRPPAEQLINTIRPPAEQLINTIRPPAEQLINTIRPPAARQINTIRPPAAQLINTMRPPTARQINAIRPPAAQLINTMRPPAAQLINTIRPPAAQLINTIRPPAAQLINIMRPPVAQQVQGIRHLTQPIQIFRHSAQQFQIIRHPVQQTQIIRHSDQQFQIIRHPVQQTQIIRHSDQQFQIIRHPVHQTQIIRHSDQQFQIIRHSTQQTQFDRDPPQEFQIVHPPTQQIQFVRRLPTQQIQIVRCPTPQQNNRLPATPQVLSQPMAQVPVVVLRQSMFK